MWAQVGLSGWGSGFQSQSQLHSKFMGSVSEWDLVISAHVHFPESDHPSKFLSPHVNKIWHLTLSSCLLSIYFIILLVIFLNIQLFFKQSQSLSFRFWKKKLSLKFLPSHGSFLKVDSWPLNIESFVKEMEIVEEISSHISFRVDCCTDDDHQKYYVWMSEELLLTLWAVAHQFWGTMDPTQSSCLLHWRSKEK